MNKKTNVYLMYIIVFLQGLVFYGPVSVLYRQNRHLSISNIFLIESLSWVLMIIMEVPWGYFADRFGYRRTLIISNIIFFISKVIFFEAHSFPMFLLERIFLSIALSGLSGCDIAFIYSSIKQEESEKVLGTYSALSTAGYFIAAAVSSIMVSYSLDSTALFTMIPYGIAAILTFFLKEVRHEHQAKPRIVQSMKLALKSSYVILLIISASLINEAVQAIGTFLNQPQYVRSGISVKCFGVLTLLMQLICLSSAKSYKLSKRLGENKSIQMLYSIVMIFSIVLVFTSNDIITIISIVLISGSGAAMNPLILNIENKCIPAANRATLLSIYSMFGEFISAGANVVIGKTSDISLQAAFLSCTVMCIAASILFTVYVRKRKLQSKISEVREN